METKLQKLTFNSLTKQFLLFSFKSLVDTCILLSCLHDGFESNFACNDCNRPGSSLSVIYS